MNLSPVQINDVTPFFDNSVPESSHVPSSPSSSDHQSFPDESAPTTTEPFVAAWTSAGVSAATALSVPSPRGNPPTATRTPSRRAPHAITMRFTLSTVSGRAHKTGDFGGVSTDGSVRLQRVARGLARRQKAPGDTGNTRRRPLSRGLVRGEAGDLPASEPATGSAEACLAANCSPARCQTTTGHRVQRASPRVAGDGGLGKTAGAQRNAPAASPTRTVSRQSGFDCVDGRTGRLGDPASVHPSRRQLTPTIRRVPSRLECPLRGQQAPA